MSKRLNTDNLDEIFDLETEVSAPEIQVSEAEIIDEPNEDVPEENDALVPSDPEALEVQIEPDAPEEVIIPAAKEMADDLIREEHDAFDSKDDEITKGLHEIMDAAKEMLSTVTYSVVACKDNAEVINAGASMLNSVNSLVTEFNKAVLQRQKFIHSAKLEKLRQEGRKEIARLNKKTNVIVGEGGTVNVQNNTQNTIGMSQEDIVRSVLKEMKSSNEKPTDVSKSES